MERVLTWSLIVALGPLAANGAQLPKCTQTIRESPARTKYVISDLHLGLGRKDDGNWYEVEDFRFADTFQSFLDKISPNGRPAVDLIIAGDFIDFWQIVLPDAVKEQGATEEESLRKLEMVLRDRAHRATISALARFVERGNRLVLVPGNHDADLNWPAVQRRLLDEFGAAARPRIILSSGCYRAPGLHVEHGHQADYANRFANADAPFVTTEGGRRLETNWGSVFVASFYNQLERKLPFIDNLHPETAAAWWALHQEPIAEFALPQVGRLGAMLLRDQEALRNLGYVGYSLGEGAPSSAPIRTTEDLLRELAAVDPETVAKYRTLLEETAQRADDARDAVDGLSQAERATRLSRTAPNLGVLLRGDPYVERAQRIAKDDRSIRVVVMGHTHDLEEKVRELDVGSGGRWYANTGCWQKSLAVKDARDRGWDKLNLDDPAIFPDRFSYIRIEYNERGIREPAKEFWPPSRID